MTDPEALRRYEVALEYSIGTDGFVRLELATHGRNSVPALFKIARLYETSARLLAAVEPPEGQEEFHAAVIAADHELAALMRQRGLYLTAWPTEILEKSDLFDALDKRARRLRDKLASFKRH